MASIRVRSLGIDVLIANRRRWDYLLVTLKRAGSMSLKCQKPT